MQVEEMAHSAEYAIAERNKMFLVPSVDDEGNETEEEGHLKQVRHYTPKDVMDVLHISRNTVTKWTVKAGIDPKRFEGATWLINIEDLYKLIDCLTVNKVKQFKYTKRFKRSAKQKCQIIALANQKGGCGKTTTAATLAAAMATSPIWGRMRIGVWDGDSQGTLSMYYATKVVGNTPGATDLLLGEYDIPKGQTRKSVISSAFLDTTIPNLRILPTSPSDKRLEATLHQRIAAGTMKSPYMLMKDVLEHVKDEFDIIIIDTPPSMNYSVYNALAAATSLIIPIPPTENDRDATLNWVSQLPTMYTTLYREGFEGYFDEIKFLITNYDAQASAIEVTNSINEAFGTFVFNTPVNSSEAFVNCASELCTIYDMSKSDYSKSKKSFESAVTNMDAVTTQIMKGLRENWKRQEKDYAAA